ncbi:MAG: DegT/DnrJ/EryC1/StrS family aminotransferase, partial [Cyanobacteria bacterium J06648_10]
MKGYSEIRTRKQFLVFGAPAIEDAEIQEVVSSMTSGWLGTGPKVARFEDDFRDYKKAEHALAVNSCTAALHLSLLAAGVGPGDEVITTALTFCSSA